MLPKIGCSVEKCICVLSTCIIIVILEFQIWLFKIAYQNMSTILTLTLTGSMHILTFLSLSTSTTNKWLVYEHVRAVLSGIRNYSILILRHRLCFQNEQTCCVRYLIRHRYSTKPTICCHIGIIYQLINNCIASPPMTEHHLSKQECP